MWSSLPIGWMPQKRLNNAAMYLSVFGEQPLLHRVEGCDAFLLPVRGILSGEAHHQEREAVAGHQHLGELASSYINIFTGRKIALSEIVGTFKNADRAKHVFVLHTEVPCDLTAGDGQRAIAGHGVMADRSDGPYMGSAQN